MNRTFIEKLLLLILLVGFTACNSDSNDTADDALVSNRYLTGVLAEKHVGKAEIAALVAEYASEQGLNISETLLTNLICDVDVAAINYTTTGVDGTTVTASGVVAIPAGTTTYDHLLSIQHGTLDMEEAPSRQLFYYEMMPVIRGHIVVMADYLGYGSSQTEDRQHPYLHNRLTGVVCADMIEAAREYLRSKSIVQEDDDLELIGYSQGGQATVATLLELENRGLSASIRAAWAGGGAYDLESVLQSFLSEPDSLQIYERSGYVPYLIRGMIYGEHLIVSDENLYAPTLIEQGLNAMFSTQRLSKWHEALGTDLTKVIHPDFYAAPTYNNNADVLAVVAALQKNSLVNASTTPRTTLVLYHSPTDDFVPYTNAVDAHNHWPTSTLIDLTMPNHVYGGVEFLLRYMGLWDLFGPMLGV